MATIKFVRFYEFYGMNWGEINYKSGRSRYMKANDLPKTAVKWLEGKRCFEFFSTVFNRNETIYASDEDIEKYKEYAN